MDAQVVYERQAGGNLQHGPCEFVRVGVRYGNRIIWLESAHFPGSDGGDYQSAVQFASDLVARWNEFEVRGDAASRLGLISDLSDALADEGPSWSNGGIDNLRRRTASVLPDPMCPDWLRPYRSSP
jgi:hypothetical protein